MQFKILLRKMNMTNLMKMNRRDMEIEFNDIDLYASLRFNLHK